MSLVLNRILTLLTYLSFAPPRRVWRQIFIYINYLLRKYTVSGYAAGHACCSFEYCMTMTMKLEASSKVCVHTRRVLQLWYGRTTVFLAAKKSMHSARGARAGFHKFSYFPLHGTRAARAHGFDSLPSLNSNPGRCPLSCSAGSSKINIRSS